MENKKRIVQQNINEDLLYTLKTIIIYILGLLSEIL